MKKTILTKVLFIMAALAFSSSSYGQIKVDPSNNVLVGQLYGQNALNEFDVRGEMFVSHSPRNGASGWSYVGGFFTNHSCQVGGNTVYKPIFQPQWGHSYWLCNASSPFWRVYANQMHATSFVNTSDELLRTNFMPVNGSLSRLMKIQPYRYDFIFEPDEKGDKRTNQEVEAASKNHINCFIKSDLKTKYSSKLALS
jgi:hypothetical protein